MAEDTDRLAERLAKLEGLLEGVLPHLATKADVQAVRNDMLWLKRLFWGVVVAVLYPLVRDLLGLLPSG